MDFETAEAIILNKSGYETLREKWLQDKKLQDEVMAAYAKKYPGNWKDPNSLESE